MAVSLTLIDLAGFIALLLWGVHMVQSGIQRAFGANLRHVVGRAISSRLRAFLSGLVVTALLQSSTATGLMVAGFVAEGIMALVPALAVMLGANVGTTLIVQLLSFDVVAIAPVFVLVGVVMFRRGPASHLRDIGRSLIGLGLILIALHQILNLITPYEDAPSLRLMLSLVVTEPVLAVVFAALLTWAAHSSVTIVLLAMSFAARGVIPPEAAFAVVLGANLGTALNPVFEGVTGTDPAARRLPIGNLINRLAGVVLGLLTLHWVGPWLVALEPDDARAVANYHTAFNLIMAALFLPFLTQFARLLEWLLPPAPATSDPGRPLYLDPLSLTVPVVALGAAAREALRLADILEQALMASRAALSEGDRRRISDAKRLDDVIDRINRAIRNYLSSLDVDQLTEDDRRRMNEILSFATNIEHAGDIVTRSLLVDAGKRIKRGLTFSKEGQVELIAMVDRLIVNLRGTASLLMTGDARAARVLTAEKETFRAMEAAEREAHFARMRAGRVETIETDALHLDILRDLRRINAHLVAAAAEPVLQREGELLPSRLKPAMAPAQLPAEADDEQEPNVP
ncbi:Na/Pi cotransporter family protein [Pseudoxanthobacter sp.]|uniref:Na/Pi cotransporter family protein n=1 Tax=Pseudoxanthobacter sp. TaxID=1925742 RepID=UPI002FE2F291